MTDLRELLREARDDLLAWSSAGLPSDSIAEKRTLDLTHRIDAALAQTPDAKPVATLICPKCGVDRFKSPCGNALHIMTCPLQSVALAAPQPPAGKGEGQLSCGHPVSLMRKSAETGEDLFCELCDCRSARSDAEAMETKYKAERDAFQALLQEGADGFGRILIATGDDKAVYDWTKRVRAALKGKSIVAAAIPREIHERLMRDAKAQALRDFRDWLIGETRSAGILAQDVVDALERRARFHEQSAPGGK
jgi:hypothetical protein